MKRKKYHNYTTTSTYAIKRMKRERIYLPNKNGYLAPLIVLYGVLILLILAAIIITISLLISL